MGWKFTRHQGNPPLFEQVVQDLEFDPNEDTGMHKLVWFGHDRIPTRYLAAAKKQEPTIQVTDNETKVTIVQPLETTEAPSRALPKGQRKQLVSSSKEN